ncbi:MAG: hypothetical protein ABIF88_02790 [archaeon]
MANTPWILIAIATLIILLGIIFLFTYKIRGRKKAPTDYYTFFILGIIWVVIGIPYQNYTLSAMGFIFMIIGATHKKDWKKNHEANKWENLSKEERKLRFWIIVSLGILVFVGLAAFLFVSLM